MSIQSEITRLQGNISASLDAVAAKGVTVGNGDNSDSLAGLIGQIPVQDDSSYKAFIGRSTSTPKLPDDLTAIGSYAFYNWTGIESITLPEGVASIGTLAFYGCTGLQSVVFLGNVGFIAVNAFSGCSNLTNISVPWSEGAVMGAPGGATNATITYNTAGRT